MSRRLRVEAEKLKQLNTEVQEEEDKAKRQKERIHAPIVWKRLNNSIRIQDLKPQYYETALKYIEDFYLKEEVLCRNCRMADDELSKRTFLDKILFVLKDNTSIIALNEENDDEVMGFIVLKAVPQYDFTRVFSRVYIGQGEAFAKYAGLINHINRKSDIYEKYKCDTYLRFYLICVRHKYRRRGIGFELMISAVDVARSLDIPIICGIFTSTSLQKKAKKLSMQVVNEINYVDWRDRYNEMIFDEPGIGNYSCAVMAGELNAYEPPKRPIIPVIPPIVKTSRGDKRKQKEKAAKK